MNVLTEEDLGLVIEKLPRPLRDWMRQLGWTGRIFVAGGFIRATVAGEEVNDIDIFTCSKADSDILARDLLGLSPQQWPDAALRHKAGLVETVNSFTLTSFSPAIQIIHRWNFESASAAIAAFDFTICCAAIWFDGPSDSFKSVCDPRFYPDLAAKRIVYRSPKREENPAGSLLRALKFVRLGYSLSNVALAGVLGRLLHAFELTSPAPEQEHMILSVLNGPGATNQANATNRNRAY